jgi:hypothetical protein
MINKKETVRCISGLTGHLSILLDAKFYLFLERHSFLDGADARNFVGGKLMNKKKRFLEGQKFKVKN